jgi:lysophospholipase L1-like esterase
MVLGVIYGGLKIASAQDASPWSVREAPTLTKIVDLPANTTPESNNVDCAKQTLQNPLPSGAQTVCTFASPLGQLTTDGKIQTGTNKFIPLYGPDGRSVFVPTTNSSVALLEIQAPGIGNYIGLYRHLSKANLQLLVTANSGTYYSVAAQPDAMVRNPSTGQPLELNASAMAFSADGNWLVADLPHLGLARIDMATLDVQLFAAPVEPSWYLGIAGISLAISNDGRYVAANTDIFGDGNLMVYDTATCSSQLDAASGMHAYCTGKNIWQGQTVDWQPMGDGLLLRKPGMLRATHIRFVNDNSISFSALYDVMSGTVYSAANFVATAPGTVQHEVGLLGMGDSYISGQGAFSYRDGTDTQNDGCHLSELSYPFIIGAADFNSYNSIACSGATTDKIVGSLTSFKGQVKDGISEDKRSKPTILANFLPGYIYQQEFAATYQPEAIVVSVGGDDVGFADIVKQCVANQGGGTCYDTYEDRAELASEINRTYPKLVHAYQTLREQSGGARVYVVGYPQIAKPGGDCGLNVHLNADELDFSAGLITYLDSALQQAARTAGVAYVDTQHALDGYRLCEAPQGKSAVNGFTVGNDAGVTVHGKVINFIGAESFHPTVLGYQLLARAISAQTNNLSAGMPQPAPYAVPTLDPELPWLLAAPASNRTLADAYYDATIADDVIVRGAPEPIAVDNADAQLQPISPYQAVLHSNPVVLANGAVASDGTINANVTVPTDVPPGYHTLHIYAKNMAGQDVDIQKIIYVAASVNDYDGDGVLNTASPCLLFVASGQDRDHDGIDDACDSDIGPESADATAVTVEVSTVGSQASIAGSAATAKDENTKGALPALSAQAVSTTSTLSGSQARHQLATLKALPAAKLYRVNWVYVLGAFAAIITAITAVNAYKSTRSTE